MLLQNFSQNSDPETVHGFNFIIGGPGVTGSSFIRRGPDQSNLDSDLVRNTVIIKIGTIPTIRYLFEYTQCTLKLLFRSDKKE